VLTVFVVWDILAVEAGVWSFNRSYIIGIRFAQLPLEEILFFISVPVASILVWEATGFWGGRD
ncbi:MAG: lycopene cyclase domain-containing protein, partial [Candidatus Kryptoniota bacterium]